MQRTRRRARHLCGTDSDRMGLIGPKISSHFRRFWELESSCSILILSLASRSRSSGLMTLCISLDHSCTTFSRSFLLLSSAFLNLAGEFLFEHLPCLPFEPWHPFEEPPCFLLRLSEALFFLGTCFPVVPTSSQLITLLTRELLSH